MPIPNPKKSIIVDFSIEKIKNSVRNINLVNKKYKFTRSNEIFNQYTFESLEFLSLGVFIDINLTSLVDKTEITVEIRRKVGSFDQSHEITMSNIHLENIFSAIALLTTKSVEEIELLKSIKNKDNRPFYKKKRFLIPIAFLFLSFLLSLIS